MERALKFGRVVTLVTLCSSVMLACTDRRGFRAYRHDQAKLQELRLKKLSAEQGNQNDNMLPALDNSQTNLDAQQPPHFQGNKSPDSKNQVVGNEANSAAGTGSETAPPNESQLYVEIAGELTLENLEVQFNKQDAKLADFIKGVSAVVTKADDGLTVKMDVLAGQDNGVYAGEGKINLNSKGAVNRVSFQKKKADGEGSEFTQNMEAFVLCKDDACNEMLGLIVLKLSEEEGDRVKTVFKMKADGILDGPFKTFNEALDASVGQASGDGDSQQQNDDQQTGSSEEKETVLGKQEQNASDKEMVEVSKADLKKSAAEANKEPIYPKSVESTKKDLEAVKKVELKRQIKSGKMQKSGSAQAGDVSSVQPNAKAVAYEQRKPEPKQVVAYEQRKPEPTQAKSDGQVAYEQRKPEPKQAIQMVGTAGSGKTAAVAYQQRKPEPTVASVKAKPDGQIASEQRQAEALATKLASLKTRVASGKMQKKSEEVKKSKTMNRGME